MARESKVGVWLGLGGLAAGYGFGVLAHRLGGAPRLEAFLGPIGNLWSNALRVAVVPLAFTLIVTGVAAPAKSLTLGRWGWLSAIAFVATLILGGLITWALFGLMPHIASISANGSAPPPTPFSLGTFVESLIPQNFLEALTKGDMLPVVIVALIFGFALRRVGEAKGGPVLGVFEGVRDAILVYIRWVIWLLPVGAFCLAFAFAAKSGPALGGALLQFLGFEVTALTVLMICLYAIVAVLGRMSIKRFAIAALPAQEVALGTRSSLAALPSTIDAARAMELPDETGSFFLPLAAAIFRPNRTVSSVARLLVVGAATGVALGPGQIVTFVLTVVLLSMATPGIPNPGSTGTTLGAYAAAGLPIPVVILFESVNALTDMLKTLYNVTAYLATAVLVSRFAAPTKGQE